MWPIWFGAWLLVSPALAAPVASDAGPSLFSAVPAECERVRAAIDAAKDSGYIAPTPLRELAEGDCARAIAAGRWPELTSTLARSNVSAQRGVLCTLGPPEAAHILAAWLNGGVDIDGDNPACALTLLHLAPHAFSEIMHTRLGDPERKQVDELVLEVALRMQPAERSALLPALEQATARGLAGRETLHARLCAAEPARSAPACTMPVPPKSLYDHEKMRSVLPALWPHVLGVLIYAALLALAQRKWGRAALPVPLASFGTIAFFVLICLLFAQNGTEHGPLGAAEYVFALLVGLPAALFAGVLVTWVALRSARISPAHWCAAQAALYIPLAFYYEWTKL